ncbi:conserved Plasmodium protein, unknown function [Plasmodium gallinaceum]|uniref:Uncharacterized protein n=1 Tax=Plasmodium gallinaceum TaxID=5849 RepID=A0A1J1GT80_PLAGA|nr:conserved Plasmodium protein, unknown function [Plasmodium gallinaceum]CRG95655.1 conserved Plasmodium protein, unknown function [Plasmodium gallinaceum]
MSNFNEIMKIYENNKSIEKNIFDEINLNNLNKDTNKFSLNDILSKVKNTEFEQKNNTIKNKFYDIVKKNEYKRKKPMKKEQEKYEYEENFHSFQNEVDNLNDFTMYNNNSYIDEIQKLNENKTKKIKNNNKLNSVDYIKILNIISEKQFNDSFYKCNNNNDCIKSFNFIQQGNGILNSNLSNDYKKYISEYLMNKEEKKLRNKNLIRYNKKEDTFFRYTSKNKDNNTNDNFQKLVYNNNNINAIYGNLSILKKKKIKKNKEENNKNDNIKYKTGCEFNNFEDSIPSNSSSFNRNKKQIRSSSNESILKNQRNIYNSNLRNTKVFDKKKKLENSKYSFDVKFLKEKKSYEDLENKCKIKIKNEKKSQNLLTNVIEKVKKENITSIDEKGFIKEMENNNNKESSEKNELKKKNISLNTEVNDRLRKKIRCKFKIKKINKSIISQTNSSNLYKNSLDNSNKVISDNSDKKSLNALNKNLPDKLSVNMKKKKIKNKQLDKLIENEKEKKDKEYFSSYKSKEKYLKKKENSNNSGNINYSNKIVNNKDNYNNKNIIKETTIKKKNNSENVSNKKDKKHHYYLNENSKIEMKEKNYNNDKHMNRKNFIYPKKYSIELIKNYKYLDERMKNYINEQIKYYGNDLRRDHIENINMYIMKNLSSKNLGQNTKRNYNTLLTNTMNENYYKKLDEKSEDMKYDMSSDSKLFLLTNKEAYKNISVSSYKEAKKHFDSIYGIKKKNMNCYLNQIKNNNVFTKEEKGKNYKLTKKNNLKEAANCKLDTEKYINFFEVYSYLTNEKNILEKMLNEKEKRNTKCHLEELKDIEKKMIKFIDNFEQIITRKQDEKSIFNDNIYKKSTTFEIDILLKILDEIIQIINNHFNYNKK